MTVHAERGLPFAGDALDSPVVEVGFSPLGQSFKSRFRGRA
ncbi:MAG: hypothetical protein U0401_14520 [Anaerolineae bacterium]